ncbi:hypothetical protein [Serinibacter arcticus]|uniref:Uncharacterized protein n=1 Tax=Serinibacter arcticus TaxID=1655435 RepID=A0A4Z1E001_9MICO|nr:hypothetical protein [Serinibacter arcticus]TGO03932.1 hypothetical protein SERN_2944 [Serinibacter arcticus]
MSSPYGTPPPIHGNIPPEPSPLVPAAPTAPPTEPSPPSFPPATTPRPPDDIRTGSGSDSGSSEKVEEAKAKAGEVAGTAKDQAAGVAQDAKASASEVAGTAKDEAAKVASSAKDQASSLLHEATQNLRTQTTTGKEQAAVGLRGVSSELSSLAEGSQDQGPVADLARQASQRLGGAAGWLEDRDLDAVLSDVQDFARRRPFAFLAISVGAGVAVGRLTRALKDSPSSTSGRSSTASGTTSDEPDQGGDPTPASTGRHTAADLSPSGSVPPSGTTPAPQDPWGAPGAISPERP